MADISSLVQESLSVSGILLGKTMGRGGELADRFESRVGATGRPRGAPAHGRPLGDGHDPDDLRDHAGARLLVRREARWSGGAISIGTLVAFTTVQTRLFFPIGQLLSVQIDVQTSLALFDRVFEYLDLPVEITERDGARTLPRETLRGRGRAPTTSSFRYGDDAWTLDDVVLRGCARHANRDRRRDRLRQDDARLPRRAALRRRARRGRDRRRRRARSDVRLARRSGRRRLAGDLSLPRVRAREPPLRVPRRDRRGDRGCGARCPDPSCDRGATRGLRHGRRRARLPLLGRREAAHGDRAHDPPQPADPRPRRGDERARYPDRARSSRRRSKSSSRAGRRSRSPTASRPCGMPSRSSSWTAGTSSSAARTTS